MSDKEKFNLCVDCGKCSIDDSLFEEYESYMYCKPCMVKWKAYKQNEMQND